jgi:hypothetical protein
MERILTNDAALARLTRDCQTASNPVITSDRQSILNECQIASLWVTGTVYKTGDVVQPNTPNGHRYICIQGGTSGATEPDWLGPDDSLSYRNTLITDGTSDPVLTWREDGEEYASLWDLRLAAYKGWKLKASLAICAVDVRTPDLSVSNSQLYEHCEKMANRFAPVMVG